MSKDFLHIVYREIREREIPLPISLRGYTEMHMKDDAQDNMFCAHPKHHGSRGHDWGYIDSFTPSEDMYYPSLILGFVTLPLKNDLSILENYAAVRTSIRPVPWEQVEKNFVQEFKLSTDVHDDHVLVPLESIVYPLIVFHDHGGTSNSFFVTLPKRCWGKYFSDQINL